jgi:hypothetical protein
MLKASRPVDRSVGEVGMLKASRPVDRSVGEVGMLKASRPVDRSVEEVGMLKVLRPVDRSVGEVGMLKASNWAEHSQRGPKETKGEKEELSEAAAPAPILEVPGSTLRGPRKGLPWRHRRCLCWSLKIRRTAWPPHVPVSPRLGSLAMGTADSVGGRILPSLSRRFKRVDNVQLG